MMVSGTYQQSELTQKADQENLLSLWAPNLKNLHIGFSLGISEASHNMSRNILEEDFDNVYDGDLQKR